MTRETTADVDDDDLGAAEVLRFEPWQSAVDPGFFAELARRKLDSIGLSEAPLRVTATYATAQHALVSSPASMARASFAEDGDDAAARAADARAATRALMPGTLHNVNTFERFKTFDRARVLADAAGALWSQIASGAAEEDPSLLNRFAVVAFADLKRWSFYYLFAFPAMKLTDPVKVLNTGVRSLTAAWGEDVAVKAAAACDAWLKGGGAFAWLYSRSTGACYSLTAWKALTGGNAASADDVALAFADACCAKTHPGWALRNLALLAAARWNVERLRVVAARSPAGRISADACLHMTLALPAIAADAGAPPPGPAVGWELNAKGRAGPRCADLGASMDPTRLATQAVDLNLKLMRWRLLPELDADALASTRCLLLGAGTLGCAVARCLLGWGVRAITLLDSGKVSFRRVLLYTGPRTTPSAR